MRLRVPDTFYEKVLEMLRIEVESLVKKRR